MGVFTYVGLPVLLHKGNSAVERAVEAEAEAMRSAAEAGVSTDTGTLGGGIEAQVEGKSATVATTAEAHPGQAEPQEVGSIHNPATHYMEQAAMAAASSFPTRLAAESSAEF